ncbi:branched-chain amino acid transport protein [Nocardioidaceae bacterium Broad-1]|uniref:branched-chain amino acid transporter permease n=1 Tax=Nocardioides luteus TaxID=1844 RepID=UPI0002028F42|nr:AzlD domain-containing protein [Nocardioides luteus]EGD43229.1 branched-chain amino acid transport protein [Nocardioidaceae bacterium Broad-1]MBG6097924.1 branched-subunit amino acid transport protein AzlD [Nocardioides luteus]
MTDPWYVLSAIAVSAAVTWALRAVPFAMLAPLRHSALMAHIGERMPVGMMVILAAYTLRDTDPAAFTSAGPAVLALALTIGLHVWRGSMTLSIFAGTAAYVLVTSVLAA